MKRKNSLDKSSPAPYPETLKVELESIHIVEGLCLGKLVMPNISRNDKTPNNDGHIELLDTLLHPTGQVCVQIKGSRKNTCKYKCDASLIGYSKTQGNPFLLIFVSLPTRAAYWKQIHETMDEFDCSKKSFTIHFTTADLIDKEGSFVTKWSNLCDEYKRYRSNGRLASNSRPDTLSITNKRIELLIQIGEQSLRDKIQTFYNLYNQGNIDQALKDVTVFLNSPESLHISDSDKSRAFRICAYATIASKRDIVKARQLSDDAYRLSHDVENTVLQAFVLYHEGHKERAYELLAPLKCASALHLRVQMCLQDNDIETALSELASCGVGKQIDTETHRLRSIALLYSGKDEQALQEIDIAFKANPNLLSLKRAKACILYQTCMQSTSWHRHETAWPTPPNNCEVLLTTQKIAHLTEAASLFKSILDEPILSAIEREEIEVWYTATLLLNRASFDEGIKYLRSGLSSPNINPPLILWALAIDLSFDDLNVRTFLTTKVETAELSITDIQIFAQFYIARKEFSQARQLLANNKHLFDSDRMLAHWRNLYAQILGFCIDTTSIFKELLDAAPVDSREELQFAYNRTQFITQHKYRQYARAARRRAQRTQTAIHLYEAADASMSAKEYSWVVSKRDQLLNLFPSEMTLRLILEACIQAHETQIFLEVSDRWEPITGSALADKAILKYKVHALNNDGRLTEAATLACRQAENTSSPELLKQALQASFAAGDFEQLRTVSTRLMNTDVKAAPDDLIDVASCLAPYDKCLASQLLLRAAQDTESVAPEKVPQAFILAHQLGLQNCLVPLIQRFNLSDPRQAKHVIAINSLDELVEIGRKNCQADDEAWCKYLSSEIPLHILASHGSTPLAAYVLATLLWNRAPQVDVSCRIPILAFYGRPMRPQPSPPIVPGSLMMDLSALYLAQVLGVLQEVETAFSPILLPRDIPSLLLHEEANVNLPRQPLLKLPQLKGCASSNELIAICKDSARQHIAAIRQRVLSGMSSGKYRATSERLHNVNSQESYPPLLRSLGECTNVLLDKRPEVSHVWVDDRWLNGKRTNNKVSIETSLSILRFLNSTGAISPPQYYSRLMLLRQMHLFYVPCEAAELSFWLSKADALLPDGQLQETPDLKTLRAYISDAILQGFYKDSVSSPTTKPQLPGELQFFLWQSNQIGEALRDVWSSATNARICYAQSNWIIDHLYFLFSVCLLPFAQTIPLEHANLAVGSMIGQLLIHAMTIPGKRTLPETGEVINPRTSFLHWLNAKLIRRSIGISPSVASCIREAFETMVKQDMSKANKDLMEVCRSNMASLFSSLQQANLHELLDVFLPSDILMSYIGAVDSIVLPSPIDQLPSSVFWPAVSEALDNGKSIVTTKQNRTLTFEAPPSFTDHILLKMEGHNQVFNLKCDDLIIASSDPTKRQSFLQQKTIELDIPRTQFQAISDQIMQIAAPDARINFYNGILKQSAVTYYNTLKEHIADDDFCGDLIPNVALLLKYLRIDKPENGFDLDTTSDALLADYGLEETIRRLSLLPILPPKNLVQKFLDLPLCDKRKTVESLGTTPNAPLSRKLVLLEFMLLAEAQDSEKSALRNDILSSQSNKQSFRRIRHIFSMTINELIARTEIHSWATSSIMAVAWLHATQLDQVLSHFGDNYETLLDRLHRNAVVQAIPLSPKHVPLFKDVTLSIAISYNFAVIRGLLAVNGQIVESGVPDYDNKLFPTLDEHLKSAENISANVVESAAPLNGISNLLNSYLGSDLLAYTLGNDDRATTAETRDSMRQNIQAVIERYSGSLNVTTKDDFSLLLWCGFVLGFADSAQRQQLSLLLKEHLSFSDLIAQCGENGLTFAFLIAQHSVDADAETLVEKLLGLASYFSETVTKGTNFPKDKAALKVAIQSLCGLLKLACSFSTDPALYYRALEKVLERCPQAAEHLADHLGTTPIGIPPEYHLPAWHFYLTLRRCL
jgi:hypothetical protein